jgi:CubicO group peptidase (beta-lactamase class C family)
VSAATDACDRLLAQRQSERRLPSVSAAVFRGPSLLWYGAAGAADLDAGTPPASDTQYRLGSITKTFTAVLVLQLRDAGLLGLDDPVSAHLPDVPHGAATIRQLLAHLSGLQREPVGEVWESLVAPTREELFDNLRAAAAVLPPHRRWHYSNLAYGVLGEIVARLTGGTWEGALQARLLTPLGLARTTLAPEEPYARGYLVDPYADRADPEPVLDFGGVGSAAELWSSVGDLARWGAFLLAPDPAVLKPETLDEMCGLQVMADVRGWTLGWGLGLMLFRRGDRVLAGHTGGMPGHNAAVTVAREDGVGAAAFANSSAGLDPGGFAVDLVEAWLEHDPAPATPWAPGPPVPPEYADLLGRWWSEGTEFVFSWRDGHLQALVAGAPPGTPPAVFEPAGDGTYVTVSGRECGEPLRVVRDASGEVTKLYWATYPFTRRALPFGATYDPS